MAQNSEAKSSTPSSIHVNPSEWMSNLKEDVTIKNLTMFGTHSSCDPKIQKETILGQLNYGARFLDLHLAMHKNEICVFHDGQCLTLEHVLGEINKFVSCNETEKVIVYLQDSEAGGEKVKWADIQEIIPQDFKKLFIPKADSDKKLKDVKGNIILIAPNALKMDANWGKDSIIPYFAPEDTDTLVGLHAFLFELAVDELDEDKGKLVWVEARSRREEDEKKKEDEITEVIDVFIKDVGFYNIVTFSLLDKDHFERLKGSGMFQFNTT